MKVRTKLGRICLGEGDDEICLTLSDTGGNPIRPTEDQQKGLKLIAAVIKKMNSLSMKL